MKPRLCENEFCELAHERTALGEIVDDLDSRYYGKWLCQICLDALAKWKRSRTEASAVKNLTANQ